MSLTKEQLAMRRTGIGGSEIAAVLGLSPYSAPIDVWRAKVEGVEQEETLPMKRGRIMEPALADWYAEDTGAKLREVGTVRHPKSKVLFATPDRIAELSTGERVLEIKTANFRMLSQWGDPGTDEVPEAYLLQAQLEMAVTNLRLADMAVLIAGDDFRIYQIEHDGELEHMLIEAAERFWRDYVVTKRAPPPDASERYTEWLKARYPTSADGLVPASADDETYARKLRAIREELKRLESEETEARNHLLARIAAKEGLQGDGWRATYRQTKGRPSTDWKALCSEAKVPEALFEKYSKRTPYRVFRFDFKGESNE